MHLKCLQKLAEYSTDLEKVVSERTRELRTYRMAVESSSNHIIITDADGLIIFANKAAQKATGYSFSEMRDKTPELWGKQMSKDFYKKLWHTIKTERKSFLGEIKNKRKNGEIYTAIAHISPIVDRSNELVGFVGTEEDITYRVIYENKLRELDKTKTEFISMVSHQLRSAPGIINWSAELLLEDKKLKLNASQRQLIEQIFQSNKRMINLIDSLLNLRRINLGTSLHGSQQLNIKKTFEKILSKKDGM